MPKSPSHLLHVLCPRGNTSDVSGPGANPSVSLPAGDEGAGVGAAPEV